MLLNKSFEGGWTTDPVTGNQTPNSWALTWKQPGTAMLSAGAFPGDPDPLDVTLRVPECVHKLSHQLPPNEQPGGPNALILDGQTTYKVFGVGFSATLAQTVTGLTPGTLVTFRVPVQVHEHSDGSWGACGFRIGIDGYFTQWYTFTAGLNNREWVYIEISTTVQESCTICIDIEGRAVAPISFFIDALDLKLDVPGPEPNPVDYTVVVELLPQDATLDEKVYVLQQTHAQKRTLLQSADDAIRLVAPGLPDSCVNVWAKDRWNGDIGAYLHERGVVNINFFEFCTEMPEPPITVTNGPCIARGTKLGTHSIMPSLVPEHTRLCALAGAPIPFVKVVDDWGYLKAIKEHSPTTLTIARKVMPFDGAGEVQHMSPGMIREAARQYMEAYHDFLVEQSQYDNNQRLGYIDYLELLNEADPPGVDGYRNLALLMLAMLDIIETWDLPIKKAACFGLNAGTPEWDEMVAVAETGLLERIAAGGHVLTLHEGVLPFSDPIDKWWPSTIPGAPEVERAGALCGRYRYWLHLARERGVYLPIVVSEFYSGPDYIQGAQIIERIAWYDNLVKDDPEVLGFLPFTNGPCAGWMHQNYDPFLDGFYDYTVATKDRVNAACTPEPDPLVIVDIRDQLQTNPDSPWYPWQRRALDEITHVFVHHSAGAASSNVATVTAINAYHISPTGKNRPGICYTYVIGADGTIWYVSDIENVVFSQGSTTYPGDENRFGVGVCLLGSFIAGREPTGAQLDSLDKLIQRLCVLVGKDLHVWGHKDVASTQCPGDSWPFKPGWGRNNVPVLVGFNDYPGDTGTAADWLEANGKQGLIVRPIFLGGAGSALDFSAQNSQKVIVNLRYSWSTDQGGAGTLPLPGTPEWQEFVDAAIYTINNSINVWGWEIGNEYNNEREFPATGNLTPHAVVQTYNAIRAGCPGKRMSPGALDPFNAIAGDPRNWLEAVYNGITGVEFVTAHGYIRGPDANLVGSTAKFGDDPLRWQYLNYPGCITELLKALPQEYKSLPVYVTEFNHLWRTVEPDWGWVSDARATAVVEAAIDAAAINGLSGVALYRWAGDEWTLEHNDLVKIAL